MEHEKFLRFYCGMSLADQLVALYDVGDGRVRAVLETMYGRRLGSIVITNDELATMRRGNAAGRLANMIDRIREYGAVAS
jgi:hypothetical protein